jgi:hypothetical protein
LWPIDATLNLLAPVREVVDPGIHHIRV